MDRQMSFVLPSEATKALDAVDALSVMHPISWSGEART